MFRAMFVGPRPGVATKAGESGLQKVSCCSGDSSCGHAIVFQFSRKCMERGPSRFSWLPVGMSGLVMVMVVGVAMILVVVVVAAVAGGSNGSGSYGNGSGNGRLEC